jgi:uncharacterized repeat protein (TIGR03803 family)
MRVKSWLQFIVAENLNPVIQIHLKYFTAMKRLLTILLIGWLTQFSSIHAQYLKLVDFEGTNGSYPENSLILSGNALYGTASMGGANDLGCIFRVNTDGSGYTIIHDFAGTVDGSYPYAALILSGNMLYGTTFAGGTRDKGCIFKLNISNNSFTNLFSLGGPGEGSQSTSALVLSGNTLYGNTQYGGTYNYGCIFRIETDASNYSNVFDFTGLADGANPSCDLILSGDTLYGMAYNGGANAYGSIFSIKTNGTGYKQLLDFDGTATGRYPKGSLTLSGSTLYGMTSFGGTNDKGCIFSIGTDGIGYDRLYDFDGTAHGECPFGSLTISGSTLYGMTFQGGTSNLGCIFSYDPGHDRYFKLLDFDGTDKGSLPLGSLCTSNEALYGITDGGGTADAGVIFKYYLQPSDQTSHLETSFIGINMANLTWTNGNGEQRVVFLKEGTGTSDYPDDNMTYNSSPDWQSKGTQLGSSGYYCVYNGPGNSVSINGLTPETTYSIRAFEYNGNPGNEQYQTNTETGNPSTFQTASPTPIPSLSEGTVKIYSDGGDVYALIGQYNTKAELAIYTLSGICIVQSDNLVEGQNRINGPFQPGIYFVVLTVGGEQYTRKIFIE